MLGLTAVKPGQEDKAKKPYVATPQARTHHLATNYPFITSASPTAVA